MLRERDSATSFVGADYGTCRPLVVGSYAAAATYSQFHTWIALFSEYEKGMGSHHHCPFLFEYLLTTPAGIVLQ